MREWLGLREEDDEIDPDNVALDDVNYEMGMMAEQWS